MSRSITVLDVLDGSVSERTSATGTIDLPANLDRSQGVVSLDARAHGRYPTSDGKTVTCAAFVRPLSWRVTGELFLIAGASRGEGEQRSTTYRLASITEPGGGQRRR
jgi:hypothetical protein